MFRVEMGVAALLQKGDEKPLPFYTRKVLIFLPRERVKSEPGKLAFRRNGYTLILDVKDVSLPTSTMAAAEECLLKLRDLVTHPADRVTVISLANRRMPLTTSQ